MKFKPYPGGGWQAKLPTKIGNVSVRYGSDYLFTDAARPYEVWYPTNEEPTGYQTASDIKAYVKLRQ